MTEELGLEESVVASIELHDLADTLTDLAEAGLDQLFDDGVLRDIPILGTLARLRKTVGAIRDFIFVRKVVRFLIRLGRVPDSEREAFVAQLGTKLERRRLGETLVLLLDRLDDMDKPEMLARLFAAHVKGRYDLATFRRLSTALERLPLPMLPSLRHFYEPERVGFTIGGDDLAQLAATGLVGFRFSPHFGLTVAPSARLTLGDSF